jgi:outer membrane protein TolC
MRSLCKTLGGVFFAAAVWSQTARPMLLTLQQALETTLLHPQALIGEQQILASRGVQRQASGIFDPLYSSMAQQSFAPTPLSTAQQVADGSGTPKAAFTNLTTFNGGTSQLYRSGVTAGPMVELDRSRDRVLNAAGLNQSRLAYQVTIPLLRNRGADVVAARETSAGVQVQASVLDLNQTYTDLLASTAVSYWGLVGALRLAEVAASSEDRGRMLLRNVQDLIQADRIPRNDINQVRANLADRTAGRIEAEQQVVAARQQLALAMGVPPEQTASVPDPAEDFPETIPAPANDPDSVRRYIVLALSRRADYLAAQKRVAAQRSLLPPATNAFRPAIDVTFSAGYSGLREGLYPNSYLASMVYGVHGLDAVGGVRYEFAPRNNAAAGALAQVQSAIRQAELLADISARAISSEVVVSLEGVRNAGLRLAKAHESVEAFQAALDGEREKYRLGFGSLVDILTTEDRLTTALIGEVQARLEAAVELARLRHATGTLVEPNAAAPRVDRQAFVTLPALPEGR